MSSNLLKKYIRILVEASSFEQLSDAGEAYTPGENQIWYWKEEFGRDMMMGYDFLKRNHKLPDPRNLEATHVLLGKVAEPDPENIFSSMQAEVWSPQGEAHSLISKLGVGHTSMSTGDIVVIQNKVLMADRYGFVDITTGEKPNAN